MDKFKNGVTTYLTFAGKAEEAANYYCTLFRNTKIDTIVHYEDDTVGNKGEVFMGAINIDGTEIFIMDLPQTHIVPFSFATSLMYTCTSIEEYDKILLGLEAGGMLMMKDEDMNFQGTYLKRCCWVTDKFGLTWQLIVY